MSSFPAEQYNEPFWRRHRGPFRLVIDRPYKTKVGFYRSEWMKTEMEGEEVPEEAIMLLEDPRDTIVSVSVWSVREQQFVYNYTHRSIENEKQRLQA